MEIINIERFPFDSSKIQEFVTAGIKKGMTKQDPFP
jgi:hypothetical protein